MFNDPEWTTKEEWDAYAWYAFAMQEVQSIEFMLLIMVVALDAQNNRSHTDKKHWNSLYDKFGRWDLRRLFKRVKEHIKLPNDFEKNFEKVVDVRNELSHGFFWPKNPEPKDKTAIDAKKELMVAASLFSNFSPIVESVMVSLINNFSINRNDAEAKAKELIRKS